MGGSKTSSNKSRWVYTPIKHTQTQSEHSLEAQKVLAEFLAEKDFKMNWQFLAEKSSRSTCRVTGQKGPDQGPAWQLGRVTGQKSPDQGRAATGQSLGQPLAESRPGNSSMRQQSLETKPNAIQAGIHA
ncbi:hypothetical protein TNCT_423411 [Trichonephila clavata]|uniref:Uncharacterized protein n=1 Tax=Trichonephila clavata TaxID=2740835 RepID=A0A8X6IZS5_TRICU|nr:hypothetical protein TNCT_423411 [Trichonephila clavata]